MGFTECVELLLENGADWRACLLAPHWGRTALHLAISNGHLDVVRLLIQTASKTLSAEGLACHLSGSTEDGDTPLSLALRIEPGLDIRGDLCRLLMQHGASLFPVLWQCQPTALPECSGRLGRWGQMNSLASEKATTLAAARAASAATVIYTQAHDVGRVHDLHWMWTHRRALLRAPCSQLDNPRAVAHFEQLVAHCCYGLAEPRSALAATLNGSHTPLTRPAVSVARPLCRACCGRTGRSKAAPTAGRL